MAGNRTDAAKTAGAAAEQAAAPGAGDGARSGLKSWLPLIVTLVSMPLLAYGVTAFVIVPRLRSAVQGTEANATTTGKEEKSGGEGVQAKETFPLTKVMVNVSGSMGTRYLMASFTLVGHESGFKRVAEQNKDQLLDLASSVLSAKTIADLEKPGARNLIRSELISVFNTALGKGKVDEIYITEFAVQ